jgi:hypothetical protein
MLAICASVHPTSAEAGDGGAAQVVIGPRFAVASSAALSGAPTGITTRSPVFDCNEEIGESALESNS